MGMTAFKGKRLMSLDIPEIISENFFSNSLVNLAFFQLTCLQPGQCWSFSGQLRLTMPLIITAEVGGSPV